jgi:hypothetical protein
MGWHAKMGPKATTRGIEPDLRRARLIAARTYAVGSIARRGIISGQWDAGDIVRSHMRDETLLLARNVVDTRGG